LNRVVGWVVDIAAYLLFAVVFWLVAILADVLVYMATCRISRYCRGTEFDLPFDIFASLVAGCVGMLAAVALLRAVYPKYPAKIFMAVSTGFTILFVLSLVTEADDGRNLYEFNNQIRFSLGPFAGCVVGWLLLNRRGRPSRG
jgi:hypothetical protein